MNRHIITKHYTDPMTPSIQYSYKNNVNVIDGRALEIFELNSLMFAHFGTILRLLKPR